MSNEIETAENGENYDFSDFEDPDHLKHTIPVETTWYHVTIRTKMSQTVKQVKDLYKVIENLDLPLDWYFRVLEKGSTSNIFHSHTLIALTKPERPIKRKEQIKAKVNEYLSKCGHTVSPQTTTVTTGSKRDCKTRLIKYLAKEQNDSSIPKIEAPPHPYLNIYKELTSDHDTKSTISSLTTLNSNLKAKTKENKISQLIDAAKHYMEENNDYFTTKPFMIYNSLDYTTTNVKEYLLKMLSNINAGEKFGDMPISSLINKTQIYLSRLPTCIVTDRILKIKDGYYNWDTRKFSTENPLSSTDQNEIPTFPYKFINTNMPSEEHIKEIRTAYRNSIKVTKGKAFYKEDENDLSPHDYLAHVISLYTLPFDQDVKSLFLSGSAGCSKSSIGNALRTLFTSCKVNKKTGKTYLTHLAKQPHIGHFEETSLLDPDRQEELIQLSEGGDLTIHIMRQGPHTFNCNSFLIYTTNDPPPMLWDPLLNTDNIELVNKMHEYVQNVTDEGVLPSVKDYPRPTNHNYEKFSFNVIMNCRRVYTDSLRDDYDESTLKEEYMLVMFPDEMKEFTYLERGLRRIIPFSMKSKNRTSFLKSVMDKDPFSFILSFMYDLLLPPPKPTTPEELSEHIDKLRKQMKEDYPEWFIQESPEVN